MSRSTPATRTEATVLRSEGSVVTFIWGYTLLAMAMYFAVSAGRESKVLGVMIALLGAVELPPGIRIGQIATAFVSRRPYLLRVTLLATALPSLYLLSGEGPMKWAGYGYLGALFAAWLMRSRREAYR